MLARFRHLHITPGAVAKLLAVSLITAGITAPLAMQAGYRIGAEEVSPQTEAQLVSLSQMLNERRDALDAVKAKAEDDMDALAIRLGELQAKTMRLEAVGQRLAAAADVDAEV